MNDVSNKQKYNILISFYATPKNNKSRRFAFKKQNEIIQGEPFEWGLIIKNIGSAPTPTAKIIEGAISCPTSNIEQTMDQEEVLVKPLNPDEETKIKIDDCKSDMHGILLVKIKITPEKEDDSGLFITYQLDANHNKKMLYSKGEDTYNRWLDSIYIQNKMEFLQSRTNSHILALTIITAWESIFGIKATIKNILLLLGFAFEKLHYFILLCIGMF
ncbi:MULTISPECIES: hypothetical protein [unclassified Aeromonas]|uniref:hypothetical protein n=1 Tax=unclassified Aeromonas TaxID=257493 RepID=UPI003529758C